MHEQSRLASDFEKLAERHRKAVHQYIYSLTRNTQQAEDLTQETFVRAWEGWTLFVTSSQMVESGDAVKTRLERAWLKVIAYHTFVEKFVRKPSDQPARHVYLDSYLVGSDGSITRLETIVAEEGAFSGDDQSLARIELRLVIERILASCPSIERDMFTAHHEEGRDPDEIAERLGLDSAVVKRTISRIERAIRRELTTAEGFASPYTGGEEFNSAFDSLLIEFDATPPAGITRRQVIFFGTYHSDARGPLEVGYEEIARLFNTNTAAVWRGNKSVRQPFCSCFVSRHIEMMAMLNSRWQADPQKVFSRRVTLFITPVTGGRGRPRKQNNAQSVEGDIQ